MATYQLYKALRKSDTLISYPPPFLHRIVKTKNIEEIDEAVNVFCEHNNIEKIRAYFFLAKSLFANGMFDGMSEEAQDFLLEKVADYIKKELADKKSSLAHSVSSLDSTKRVTHPISSILIDLFTGMSQSSLSIKNRVKIGDYIALICNKAIDGQIKKENKNDG